MSDSPKKRARAHSVDANTLNDRRSMKRGIFLPNRPHLADRSFSIITGMCRNLDVLLNFVKFLPPRSLAILFSTSAPFYYQMCSHYEQFILAASTYICPDAATIFPWRCYGSLCISDPALRLVSTHTGSVDPDKPRPISTVPGIRWLRMSVYRTLVTSEIAAYIIAAGFPLPSSMPATLRKLWFLLDIPVSTPRIALIRNREYFTDRDIAMLQMFFLKLDACLTHPVAFTGNELKMREFLMAERSLTPLWNWLRGEQHTKLDTIRLWVRHRYTAPARGPRPETQQVQAAWEAKGERAPHIMGVKLEMCGRTGRELHGYGRNMLISPEELVVKESVRRGLNLDRYLIKMLRWGYYARNGQPIRTPRQDEIVWSKMMERRDKMEAEKRHKRDIEMLLECMESVD